MNSFHPNYLLKAPSPDTVALELRLLHMDLGGTQLSLYQIHTQVLAIHQQRKTQDSEGAHRYRQCECGEQTHALPQGY